MSYFLPAFIAIAEDPNGEALVSRVTIRLRDDTDFVVTDTEKTIELSEIVVKREREYGVVESQDWGVTFTNEQLAIMQNDLNGCKIVLECGFPVADEWSSFAQGEIYRSKADTGLKVTISVKDALRSLLLGSLEQDYRISATGWGGEITATDVDDASKGYDNEWDTTGVNVGVVPWANVDIAQDGFYEIEFTSATLYKVTHPDLTENTGLSIASDAYVFTGGGVIFQINTLGWNQDTDAYATGDKFSFPASSAWAAGDLNPMGIIYTLLKDSRFLDLSVFDVIAGAEYSSPLYDDSGRWTDALTRYTTTKAGGLFTAGTKYIDIIQKLLKLIHCGIYTMPNGQIALSEFLPVEADANPFNGDFEKGEVDILDGTVTDDTEWLANVVTFLYKTTTGVDATYTEEDQDSIDLYGRIYRDIDLRPLEIDSVSIKNYCHQLLVRKKDNRKTFTIETLLRGCVVGMDDPIGITESFLGLLSETCMVSKTVTDIDSNTASLAAFLEPVLFQDYAQVGDATTTPVGATVGGTLKVL